MSRLCLLLCLFVCFFKTVLPFMVNKDYRLWHHVWQGCGLGFISAADLCVSTRTDGRIYREKAIFRPHGRKK